jgi:predicted ATPase
MIHARTEGNPLFMADLLRYLKTRRTIEQVQGRWRLSGAVSELERELPESVRSMIQRKIDALGEDDRRLLIAGSVQGYEFDSAVVTRALALDPVEVEERLDALERLHALVRLVAERELPDRTPSLRYRFVHVLYQNALYASLRATRKASLSTAVANAMIELYRDQTASVASELALLLETGRDFSRSAGYFLNAAQHAAKIFANQEAVVLARRGLDLLKSLPETPERTAIELKLHIALGGPLTALNGFAANEVQQAYLRARELCAQLGDTPQLFPVLHGLFRFYIVRGDIRTARQITEQLLTLAEGVNDAALRIEAHRALGATLFCLGDFALARQHLESGLALYDPDRHRAHTGLYGADPGTVCLSWLAFALWILGHAEKARQASEQAVALARQHPHPANLAYALALASWFHQYRRDTAAVNAHAEAAIAISREHGFPLWLAVASMFRGWALTVEGEHERAITQLSEGVAKFKATGAELNLPHFYGMLAHACGKAHRFDEAFAAVEEALSVAHRNMDRCYEAELYRIEGELMLEREPSGQDAEESLLQAVDVARKQGARTFELRALTSLARALVRQGRRDEALQLLAPAYQAFPDRLDTPELKDAAAVLEQFT